MSSLSCWRALREGDSSDDDDDDNDDTELTDSDRSEEWVDGGSSAGPASNGESRETRDSEGLLEIQRPSSKRRVTFTGARRGRGISFHAGSPPDAMSHMPSESPDRVRRRPSFVNAFGLGGGGGRKRSASASGEALDVSDLPDLMPRIQKIGALQEYMEYRTGYMNWRAGGHRGAKNSIFIDKIEREEEDQPWYAQGKVWSFNNTLSYWIAVTFLEGSIIFTISCFIGCLPEDVFGVNHEAVTSWAMLFGGIFYNICTYLMCIETANLKKDGLTLNPFNAQQIVRTLSSAGIGPEPYIASITYFLGALLYTVPVVCDLLPFSYSETASTILFTGPYIAAGAFFAIGGFVECIEHEVFCTLPDHHGWWGAFLNLVGALFFFIAGIVLTWSGWWCSFLFGIGSATYTAGSLIMVIMWKDEQFGLTFLAAINRIYRPPTASPHFSLRGLAFLILYIFMSVMVLYNFLLVLRALMDQPSYLLLGALFNEGAPFVAFHMMMVVLSVNYRVPKEEPYHALMIGARIVLVVCSLKATMTFYFSVIDSHFFDVEGRGGFYECAANSAIGFMNTSLFSDEGDLGANSTSSMNDTEWI